MKQNVKVNTSNSNVIIAAKNTVAKIMQISPVVPNPWMGPPQK